jgi:hypothetical protein
MIQLKAAHFASAVLTFFCCRSLCCWGTGVKSNAGGPTMAELKRKLSGEGTSMIAIAMAAMVGGLLEWVLVIKVISLLIS